MVTLRVTESQYSAVVMVKLGPGRCGFKSAVCHGNLLNDFEPVTHSEPNLLHRVAGRMKGEQLWLPIEKKGKV